MKFSLGTDPEYALVKDGKYVSAHDIVPGTKAKPHKMDFGSIQADGCMVEFNTEPATSYKQFSKNVTNALENCHLYHGGLAPDFTPSIYFEPKYFDTVPGSAKELGCSADYNAWQKGGINPRPVPPINKNHLRTCSGHLHIGFTEGADVTSVSHRWDCCQIVKALDLAVGPFLKLFDKDTDRASLYGKPGAFRPKSYGVEWRVPSNAWLNYPGLYEWLFKACKAVFTSVQKGDFNFDDPKSVIGKSMTYQQARSNALARTGRTKFPEIPVSTLKLFGTIKPRVPNYEELRKMEVANPTAIKKIFKGVRVAASASQVSYDLDLDVPYDGGKRNYSSDWNTSEYIDAIC